MKKAIFHVLKTEHIPHEVNQRNLLSSSLDLEIAIVNAKKYNIQEFLKTTYYESENGLYMPKFYNLYHMASCLKIDGFSTNLDFFHDHFLSVHIIKADLDEPVNLRDEPIWTADEPFIFELFKDMLNTIMERDMQPKLSFRDLQYFWTLFKDDHSLFNNKEYDSKTHEPIDFYKSAAEIWTMTPDESREAELFEQFEN